MTDSEYVWLPDSSWTTESSVIDGSRCRYKGCQTPAAADRVAVMLAESRLITAIAELEAARTFERDQERR